jgi:hypothetical protein
MNPLHLLWILPITAMFGYFIAALMMAAKKADENYISPCSRVSKGRKE